jgi:hypothetical protein
MLTELKQHHEPKQVEYSEKDKEADEATVKRVRQYIADMVLDGVHPNKAYVSPHIDRINNKEPYKHMPFDMDMDLPEHPWLEGDLLTAKEVHELMLNSKSQAEWSENRKLVYEMFDGEPDFWDIIVTSTGLYQQVSKTWDKNK